MTSKAVLLCSLQTLIAEGACVSSVPPTEGNVVMVLNYAAYFCAHAEDIIVDASANVCCRCRRAAKEEVKPLRRGHGALLQQFRGVSQRQAGASRWR